MAKLIYAALTSLDCYLEDREGSFTWAMPDEEVHGYVNELERGIGTYLYGRRLYETMKVWEQIYHQPEQNSVMQEYAEIWHGTDKVVFSATLESVNTERTRLERTFDPEAIRTLKAGSSMDISVGGANLAAHALRAGLVDEIHMFLSPIVVGGGKAMLPPNYATRLELLGQRAFGNGVVHLHYTVQRTATGSG